MIRLSCSETRFRLGEVVTIHIEAPPDVLTCCYLSQHPVTYLHPVAGDWAARDELRFIPEAPGGYTVTVVWRRGDLEEGVERLDLAVGGSSRAFGGPGRVELEEGLVLMGPSSWEVEYLAASEGNTLQALHELVASGDVVYDIGASIGLYALRLARLVGEQGRVYCFEANPVCVSFLRSNVEANDLSQVEILPVALLDRQGETSFTLNYGNVNLGTASESAFYGYKTGHEIRVECQPLDRLIALLGLRPPDLIKIDVEGVEHRVVCGMLEILRQRRPRLVLELHGYECIHRTVGELDRIGYTYRIAGLERTFESAAELLDAHGEAVIQVVALPRE